jgi:hypothetical protein
MNMKITRSIFALAVLVLAPLGVQAQIIWIATSATQIDKDVREAYVSIDASASGEAFVERNPVPVEALTAIDPDGNAVTLENKLAGKTRSTADLKLSKPGTYKIGIETQNVSVSYRLPPGSPNAPPAGGSSGPGGGNGMVRKQLSTEEFKTFKLPDDATQVRITKNLRRVETFVTYDRPTTGVFKTSGVGLELIPITHPNDILPQQKASFRVLLNGKPLPDFSITAVPAGQLYRGVVKELRATTDAQGVAAFTVPDGGRYWLAASYPARGALNAPAAATDPNPAPVTVDAYTYGASLEVLY